MRISTTYCLLAISCSLFLQANAAAEDVRMIRVASAPNGAWNGDYVKREVTVYHPGRRVMKRQTRYVLRDKSDPDPTNAALAERPYILLNEKFGWWSFSAHDRDFIYNMQKESDAFKWKKGDWEVNDWLGDQYEEYRDQSPPTFQAFDDEHADEPASDGSSNSESEAAAASSSESSNSSSSSVAPQKVGYPPTEEEKKSPDEPEPLPEADQPTEVAKPEDQAACAVLDEPDMNADVAETGPDC